MTVKEMRERVEMLKGIIGSDYERGTINTKKHTECAWGFRDSDASQGIDHFMYVIMDCENIRLIAGQEITDESTNFCYTIDDVYVLADPKSIDVIRSQIQEYLISYGSGYRMSRYMSDAGRKVILREIVGSIYSDDKVEFVREFETDPETYLAFINNMTTECCFRMILKPDVMVVELLSKGVCLEKKRYLLIDSKIATEINNQILLYTLGQQDGYTLGQRDG